VTVVASTVNTTFRSIALAAAAGAQLLLVHHPSWSYIDRDLHERKLAALRDAGVSLYGAHASLDCSPAHGTGHELAALLGITVEGRFAPYEGSLAGVHGTIDGGWDALVATVASTLGKVPEADRNASTARRVGIVTGAGGYTMWLEEAIALGCDTYITGEGSMYTRLYAREAGINLLLGGHDLTERPGIEALPRPRRQGGRDPPERRRAPQVAPRAQGQRRRRRRDRRERGSHRQVDRQGRRRQGRQGPDRGRQGRQGQGRADRRRQGPGRAVEVDPRRHGARRRPGRGAGRDRDQAGSQDDQVDGDQGDGDESRSQGRCEARGREALGREGDRREGDRREGRAEDDEGQEGRIGRLSTTS
jgi:putative NIF3 family GTP cyclohydrolase 1 type 2